MGGCCCCSSKGVELSSSPPFYHYPIVSEEREPLSSQNVTSSALSTGLLVNTNLETSFPDTYRPPPAPIPFNANLGLPQTPLGNRENCGNKSGAVLPTTNTEFNEQTDTGNTLETSEIDSKESDHKGKTDTELVSSIELAVELEKSGELKKSSEPPISAPEEDVCPTCFEEYDSENPKIITKCEHHFHLSCILEWMERSDTCPVCDQEMIYDPTFDS